MGPAIHASKAAGGLPLTSSLKEQLIKNSDDTEQASDEEVVESKQDDAVKPAKAIITNLSSPGYNNGDVSPANYAIAKDVVESHREHVAARNASKKAAAAQGEAPLVAEPVLNKHYHYIHGKAYDLRPFFSKHPGGAGILEMTQGLIDSTAVFESYHAMANMPSILKQMEAYRVSDEELSDQGVVLPQRMYAFDHDGFWYTLRSRVRAHFGVHKEAASATKQSKGNSLWYFKFALFSALWLASYAVAITNLFGDFSTPVRCLSAIFSGFSFIAWGFNSMHDASHFAVAPRNHWSNQFVTELWCALALWNGKVWMFHHAVMHHSFTGNERLDPDIHHALPMVRKHPETGKAWADPFFRILGDNLGMPGWAAASILIYVLAPGMWGGQVVFYMLYRLALTKGSERMWGMEPHKNVKGYSTGIMETVLYGLQVCLHLYLQNLPVTYAYVVSLNFFYSMCIVADHDLLESAITNHLDVDAPQDMTDPDAKRQDWGEVQVRNSTDFVNDELHFFANCFGAINYQAEHHLFPGICHVHLPYIAPIVQQTCKEFGIPYTCLPGIHDAWHSFLLTVRSVMSELPVSEEELADLRQRTQASKTPTSSLKSKAE